MNHALFRERWGASSTFSVNDYATAYELMEDAQAASLMVEDITRFLTSLLTIDPSTHKLSLESELTGANRGEWTEHADALQELRTRLRSLAQESWGIHHASTTEQNGDPR